MRRSFRYYIGEVFTYAGSSLLITLLVQLFYVFMFGVMDESGTGKFMTRMGIYFMLCVLCVTYTMQFGSVSFPNALKFGATRRGWFLAGLPAKFIFAAIVAGGYILVIEPLGGLLWANTPALDLAPLPAFFCLCFLLVCLGELFGMVALRFGMRWAVPAMVLVFLALAACFFVLPNVVPGFAEILSSESLLRNALPTALALVGLSLLALGGTWLMIRRAAVKG